MAAIHSEQMQAALAEFGERLRDPWWRLTSGKLYKIADKNGDITRARLMDAAIDLTVRFGVNGWTLRDVGREAGQRHNSVVQYHVGTKEALLRAAVDEVLAAADDDFVEGPDTVRHLSRFFGQLLVLDDYSDLLTEHPKVIFERGRKGSPSQRAWVLEVLEEAFVEPAQVTS